MRVAWLLGLAMFVSGSACGGIAVIDPASGGAGGTTATSTTDATSGPMGCSSHENCPNGVCIFATGQCADACSGYCDSCSPGFVCDDCATASCLGCADCVAACQPVAAGACDEDDPCPSGEVCLWELHRCVPSCLPNGGCADPALTCVGCVTGSCCGCEDCVAACMPIN